MTRRGAIRRDDSDATARGAALGEPTLEAAMAYIEHRLKDPALTPNDVRAHLGLSRSGIYRMFAPFGGIDALVRQRRLDDAMRAILRKGVRSLPIGALATRHGFRNEAQFTRAFRARFGTLPSEVRGKVTEGDEAWLKAQAKRAGFASLEAWRAALAIPPAAPAPRGGGRKPPPKPPAPRDQ